MATMIVIAGLDLRIRKCKVWCFLVITLASLIWRRSLGVFTGGYIQGSDHVLYIKDGRCLSESVQDQYELTSHIPHTAQDLIYYYYKTSLLLYWVSQNFAFAPFSFGSHLPTQSKHRPSPSLMARLLRTSHSLIIQCLVLGGSRPGRVRRGHARRRC